MGGGTGSNVEYFRECMDIFSKVRSMALIDRLTCHGPCMGTIPRGATHPSEPLQRGVYSRSRAHVMTEATHSWLFDDAAAGGGGGPHAKPRRGRKEAGEGERLGRKGRGHRGQAHLLHSLFFLLPLLLLLLLLLLLIVDAMLTTMMQGRKSCLQHLEGAFPRFFRLRCLESLTSMHPDDECTVGRCHRCPS